jgi:anti-sigma factor RsiW
MQDAFSDATLMAYADGELDAEARAAVDNALKLDPTLQARLSVFTQTRQAASQAFQPVLDQPLPSELSDAIAQMVKAHESAGGQTEATEGSEQSNVVAFDRKPRFTARRFDMALAASIALFVGGVVGYAASGWQNAPTTNDVVVADLTSSDLPEALLTVASGDEIALDEGRQFRAIASFRDEAGSFCREFEIDGGDASSVVSVACRADEQWRVQFTVVTASTGQAFAPASSLEALDAYLSAIGAGEPLSDTDERTALDALR